MVHEAGLLTLQQVHRLVESEYPEALGVSSETAYGPYLEGASTQQGIEAGLMRFLADEYGFVDQITRGTRVVDFMHLKYDFHNLRVVLKEKYFEEVSGDRLLSGLGTVEVESLRAAAGGDSAAVVPGYLRGVMEAVSRRVQVKGADPQFIDTVVDRSFLQRRLEVASEIGSGLLVDFARATIDVANLGILLRGRNLAKGPEFYEEAIAEGGELPRRKLLGLAGEPFDVVAPALPGTRYGRLLRGLAEKGDEKARLTSLDRATDEYLLEQLHRFASVSVGPERVVRYMLARENEVAMLRVIFIGKLNALTPGMIESRLPVAYMREAVR